MRVVPLEYLFRTYLSPPPPAVTGFKRKWVYSKHTKPGHWIYEEHTIEDAIEEGNIEIDELGAHWDYVYEAWIPNNPILEEDIRSYGLENSFQDAMTERNDDYISFIFKTIRRVIT